MNNIELINGALIRAIDSESKALEYTTSSDAKEAINARIKAFNEVLQDINTISDYCVFRFRIWYSDNAIQYREVLAKTEEEALEKLIEYRNSLVRKGFEAFEIDYSADLELQNVIC